MREGFTGHQGLLARRILTSKERVNLIQRTLKCFQMSSDIVNIELAAEANWLFLLRPFLSLQIVLFPVVFFF